MQDIRGVGDVLRAVDGGDDHDLALAGAGEQLAGLGVKFNCLR